MKLEHSFTVPADLDTVWQAVLDPERVAPCMPGASLTEVEGDAFKGSVKVKLGPISLLYKGSGEFLEKDEKSRKVVIKASGKDARGNGTASATVTVTLTPNGDSTTGAVVTDLSITGKPAQFGRGLISEVGGKILDTFATCLASKLAPEETPAPNLSVVKEKEETPPKNTKPKSKPTSTASATTPPDSTNTPADSTSTPADSTSTRADSTSTSAAPTGSTNTPATPASAPAGSTNTSAGSTSSPTAPTSAPSGRASTAADSAVASAATSTASSAAAARAEATETGHKAGEATAAHAPAPTKPKLAAAPEPETEPIDLLSYAGPSVLKRAAPLLALVVAVLVFIALRRRR